MKEVAILKLLDKSHYDYSEYFPNYLSKWQRYAPKEVMDQFKKDYNGGNK